jgi:hypothetical protein
LTTGNIYVKGQQHCYNKQGDEMVEKGLKNGEAQRSTPKKICLWRGGEQGGLLEGCWAMI